MSNGNILPASQAYRQLSSESRAALAVADMRQEMLRQLWQAALGDGQSSSGPETSVTDPSLPGSMLGSGLEALLALQGQAPQAPAAPVGAPAAPSGPLQLRSNAAYTPYFESASARTGLPAAMLAAIVGAEAGSQNGVWDPNSRNPRSSAAGLTQFLSSTWISETERSGTYLNKVAAANGWLDGNGQVRPSAQDELLALRFDPRASIEAAADYARHNLGALERQGLSSAGLAPEELAKRAYLAHHLGVGDAARFLTGRLDPARAQTLLISQIGSEAASARVAVAGNATAAHRQWLTSYIDRKIRLENYQSGTVRT